MSSFLAHGLDAWPPKLGATADPGEDALDALQSIKKRIGTDLTFEEAASQYSDDAFSAAVGGDLGFSSGDSFPLEFEEALDSMSVNEISEIIEIDESIHIIKFTEENKDTPKAIDIMREQFVDDLIEAEYNPRELTKEQHKQISDSIKRFGIVDPVIVNTHKDRKN